MNTGMTQSRFDAYTVFDGLADFWYAGVLQYKHRNIVYAPFWKSGVIFSWALFHFYD